MSDLEFVGRNVLFVDVGAVYLNLRYLEELSGKRAIPVIKADGYGLGAIELGRFLEKKGYSLFAVATYEEAMELRESGVKSKILILSGSPDDPFNEYKVLNFVPVIYSVEQVNKLLRDLKTPIEVHLKFNTGMNRLGFDSVEDVLPLLENQFVKITGVMTHFAKADSSMSFTRGQVIKFKNILKQLSLNSDVIIHTANSAAVLRKLDFGNMIRPGIFIYGALPSPSFPRPREQQIPYTFYCKILEVRWINVGDRVSYGGTFVAKKKMRIAVIGCGYGDGIPRILSNRGFLYYRGRKLKVLGRVCMDMTIVDVTGIPDIGVGGYVLYIGKDGKGGIVPADEVAKKAGTIGYEILTSITKRVKRIYYVGF